MMDWGQFRAGDNPDFSRRSLPEPRFFIKESEQQPIWRAIVS